MIRYTPEDLGLRQAASERLKQEQEKEPVSAYVPIPQPRPRVLLVTIACYLMKQDEAPQPVDPHLAEACREEEFVDTNIGVICRHRSVTPKHSVRM